jgi:uncharacterized membrane protein YeaQ/YmgE (transglycosylase-associated protein family)
MSVVGILLLVLLAYVAFNAAWGLGGLIIALFVWGLIGFLAGQLTKGRGFGILGNILLGLAGGIFGNFVLSALGLGGLANIPLAAGVIGAVLLIALADFLTQNGGKRKLRA